MKKLFSILICTIAAISVLVSCTPKDVPDGKCELSAFSLTSSIAGTIDATAKTITVVIPTSVTSTSFTPTFTATEWDIVTIGGTPVTSGETSVTITDGTKVLVSDDVSVLNTEYTIIVKSNDEKVELTAISFKAADNSLLEEDVTPEEIAPEMIVRVPGPAFRQELALSVEAGFNDEIKVNNTVVASGSSIKVDTSFPIDITITDAVAGTSKSYVLKVGKILQYVATELGSLSSGTIKDFTMAINPNDNMPYFAYTSKVDEDAYNNISVAKWNGTAFSIVGPAGFADASARDAKVPKVAFGKDGSIYAFYNKADVNYLPTVRKLGTEWDLVGPAGNTPQRYNDSYIYPFFVHPATGAPFFFWNANSSGQANRRTMSTAYFSGDAWTTQTITGVIPAVDGTTAMYYTSSAAIVDDKVYVVSSFNQYGYYVHEVNGDGTLTTVVDNFLPADAPHGLPANLQMKAGPDGVLYVLAAVRSGEGSMQIFSVDKENGTFKTYGESLAVSIGSNGSISQDFGFGVNPVDGLTIIAFDDSEQPAFGYLDDNLQWARFDISPKEAESPYYVDFNKEGIGYIAYLNEEKNIVLYKVALEEDIIPE